MGSGIIVLGGVGAAAVAAAVAYAQKTGTAPALDAQGHIVAGVGFNGPGYKVIHRERANGVHPDLQAFLAQWEKDGPFPISIGTDGGVRTDPTTQAALNKNGASNALSLKDTPHGRGGAVDVWPVVPTSGWLVSQVYECEQPKTGPIPAFLIRPDLYDVIARRAEARGLQSGLRWANQYGFGPFGDAPHVQIAGWRNLRFPYTGNFDPVGVA